MKKMLIRLSTILLILQLLIFTNVFAKQNSSFIIQAQNDIEMNAGETVEVPIILNALQINDVQKGIVGLSFQIKYDEEAFELVKFDNDSYFERLVGDNYSVFNDDDLIAFINANPTNYLNQITELGKIKLKAKEGLKTGYYNVSITNVKGGNLDNTYIDLGIEDFVSKIYVNGVEDEEENTDNIIDDEGNILGTINESTINNTKDVIATIKQNEEGTKLKVTIDTENGLEVSTIYIDKQEMEKQQDGTFVATVEPDKTYVLYFFDNNNYYVTMKVISINGKNENKTKDPLDDENKKDEKNDNETKNPDKESEEDKKDDKTIDNKQEEDKKDEKNGNETKNPDKESEEDKKDDKIEDNDNKEKEGKTDNKKDSSTEKEIDIIKEDTTKTTTEDNKAENVEKSVQTGDNLIAVIVILTISILVLTIVSIITIKRMF